MWAALLPGVGPLLQKLIGLIPDPAAAAKAQQEFLQGMEDFCSKADLAQAEIDKQEAASPNLFVAGWRPFVGWVCGCSFAWVYVLQPFATFFLVAAGHPANLPTLDTGQIMPVLMGMLGLGGYRMMEKKWNVVDQH